MNEQSSFPDIQIWKFRNAPQEYRDLSENGGDEDWVAVMTTEFWEKFDPWFLHEGTAFGSCCVDEYKYEGKTVLIGCHA